MVPSIHNGERESLKSVMMGKADISHHTTTNNNNNKRIKDLNVKIEIGL